MKKYFEQFRPKEFESKGEALLYPIIKELAKKITLLEKKYIGEAFLFGETNSYILAHLLVEFAEDLHNDIGLWSSIENYNIELFGSPLPLYIKSKEEITECFDINRFKFFIFSTFEIFEDGTVLSPYHKDLTMLAEEVAKYLKEKFLSIPKDSGIKRMLQIPNEFAWDVKRKLVWVAMNSYLFRNDFQVYVEQNNNGKTEIPVIEDFICQENTRWSGLGIIDIVAKVLDLPETKRKDVRSWYERLTSYYKVIASKNKLLTLENLINNQRYEVQLDHDNKAFKTDLIIFGSIVPFGNYYYWSGLQRIFEKLEQAAIKDLKNDYIKKASSIIYRFDKTLLNKSQNDIKVHYNDFKTFFNDDPVIFKDGLSMAAALQQKDREKYKQMSKKELEEFMQKNELKNPFPAMNLSEHILNEENGIGIFFNPAEGMEIMAEFNNVKSGLLKKGVNLNQDEQEAIWELIISKEISFNFINKLINQYGSESIASCFFIENEENNINYLLHKYKGHFYRNRYPLISYSLD